MITLELIKAGDKVKIKENLLDELVRLGFTREGVKAFSESLTSTIQEVLDTSTYTYNGTNEPFITVAVGYKIPLSACELA